MKKINLGLLLIVFCASLFISGCASRQNVSANGFDLAEEAISVSNPVEYEKEGVSYITTFPIILDSGLWGVEGFSHKGLDIGIFPVLTSSGMKGYALITDSNWWGDQIMQAVVVGMKKNIGKILYLSRDGHTAYSTIGKELDYDSDKFDKDPNYRSEVFNSIGMTIPEIDVFWKKYSEVRGMEIPPYFNFVEEIEVGSPRWNEFKEQLATRLTKNYKMPNGEIRQGYMSLDDFRIEASKNNGATANQRFSRSFVISAVPEPTTFAVITIGSLLNSIVKANNGPIKGFYSMAECKRGDLKSRFREMSKKFKKLLMERDHIIFQLQEGDRK